MSASSGGFGPSIFSEQLNDGANPLDLLLDYRRRNRQGTIVIEYAKRVAVRRIVYIVIAAIIGYLASYARVASAQETILSSYQEALSLCRSDKAKLAQINSGYYTARMIEGMNCDKIEKIDHRSTLRCRSGVSDNPYCGAAPGGSGLDLYIWITTVCPAGEWPDPNNPGQCLSDSQCTARNGTGHTAGIRQGNSASWCEGGCKVVWEPGNHSRITVAGNSSYQGKVFYDGDQCPLPSKPEPTPGEDMPPEKADDDRVCRALMGQSGICAKNNGDLCATASTGRQICWKPHETGQKTDKDAIQTKKPGHQDGPPSISLPNGDTANKTKPDAKVEAKSPDGRTSNTTITNYTTASGANSGSQNQGQGNDGEGDGDGNGSGGGGSCDSPPVSSGDKLLAQIAHQAWETRCAIENTNKANQDWADNLRGQNDAAEGSGDGDGPWIDGEGISSGALDGSWVNFGASCPPPPAVTVGSWSFQWPSGFCDVVAGIRWMLIAFAYIWGLRIILSK